MFVANAYLSGDVMMCHCSVAKDRTIREKRLSLLWLFTVISCRAFCIRFWVEGQYEPRTTGSVTFASLPSNVISLFCSKDFWVGWGKWLWLERKVEGLEENFPKYVKNALISKQTLGHFNKVDLTDILSKHSTNLLTPQPHFLFFNASLPV